MQKHGRPDPHRQAVHGYHERFFNGRKSGQKSIYRARLVARRILQKIVDVVAGRKTIARTGQQQNPQAIVLGYGFDGLDQAPIHVPGQSVFLLRPLEANRHDAVGNFDAQMFGHFWLQTRVRGKAASYTIFLPWKWGKKEPAGGAAAKPLCAGME